MNNWFADSSNQQFHLLDAEQKSASLYPLDGVWEGLLHPKDFFLLTDPLGFDIMDLQ